VSLDPRVLFPSTHSSLRTMRLTHQTNLNLDMTNLVAFPPTRKLERWLRSNPQEVIPMCDQVLKE
jgi:DNA replication licensing factor MCM4